jgi:hypothetical protein
MRVERPGRRGCSCRARSRLSVAQNRQANPAVGRRPGARRDRSPGRPGRAVAARRARQQWPAGGVGMKERAILFSGADGARPARRQRDSDAPRAPSSKATGPSLSVGIDDEPGVAELSWLSVTGRATTSTRRSRRCPAPMARRAIGCGCARPRHARGSSAKNFPSTARATTVPITPADPPRQPHRPRGYRRARRALAGHPRQ